VKFYCGTASGLSCKITVRMGNCLTPSPGHPSLSACLRSADTTAEQMSTSQDLIRFRFRPCRRADWRGLRRPARRHDRINERVDFGGFVIGFRFGLLLWFASDSLC
jgi:hypothetical protein